MPTQLDTPRGKKGTINRNTGQFVDPYNPAPSAPTISVTGLQENPKPFSVAPAAVTSPARDYIQETSKSTQLSKELAQRAEETKAKTAGGLADIEATIENIFNVQNSRAQLEDDAGLAQLNTERANIENKIEAKQFATLKKIDEIRKNEGGAYGGAVEDMVAEVERQSARDLADLYIAQNALNRNFTAVKENIDSKIQVQLEPLKQLLDAQKFFYEQNKDDFTKAEDRQFQLAFKETEREYEQEQTMLQQLGQLQLEAAKNGAPQSVIAALGKAKNIEEAIKVANGWFVPVPKLTAAELKTLKEEQAAKQSEITKATQALTVIQQLKTQFGGEQRPDQSVQSIGSRAVGTVQGRLPTISKDVADFERQHRQLKALLSLDNYKLLKGTGQISNYEGQLLADAATQLDLVMSEEGYQEELVKLEEAFTSVLTRSSSLTDDENDALDEFFQNQPQDALSAQNYYRL